MNHFENTYSALVDLQPELPLSVNRPHMVKRAAKYFADNFNAKILYAVKANPSEWVLRALFDEGVKMFDVASLNEIALVNRVLPEAKLAFMHPVKSRYAIEKAYHEYGVRIFALDCMEELQKILAATNNANDLVLMVRLSVSNSSSSINLDGKFGIGLENSAELLRAARIATKEELGICFHVGSQCMNPKAYGEALEIARVAIVKAGVVVDIIDVGGGFPIKYKGTNPPAMKKYFDIIASKFESLPVTWDCELWCEPGRALVAEASSIVAKVDLRKGDKVYINDGAYGNLFDAAHIKWPFEIIHHRLNGKSENTNKDFTIYGPTCDGIDVLGNKISLPNDAQEGDYIEFTNLGAYGTSMATNFNGFGQTLEVFAKDDCENSMFSESNIEKLQPLKGKIHER